MPNYVINAMIIIIKIKKDQHHVKIVIQIVQNLATNKQVIVQNANQVMNQMEKNAIFVNLERILIKIKMVNVLIVQKEVIQIKMVKHNV